MHWAPGIFASFSMATSVPDLKGREAIASDCLNQSDLKQVYNVVFKARAKWRRIGLQLELNHGDLEAINSHYRNPDDQLEQVLAKWLKGGEATWRQLMEALYSVSVGETALAKQIRMKHCQDVPDLGVKRKHDDGRQQREKCISSMEDEYAQLSLDIRKSLKRREIRPQELSVFLLSFQSTRGALKLNANFFINSCQQELKNANTIDAVFLTVSLFWSFLDYNLLEKVVEEFGDFSDKQKFADYTKALEEFLSDWKVIPHKIQRSEIPTTAVKLCFKFDSDSLPYRDIRASIARIFKVDVSNVLIQSFEKGSTKLVFLLPREAVVPYLTAELRKEIAEQIAALTPSVLHVLLLDGCEEHTLFESALPDSSYGYYNTLMTHTGLTDKQVNQEITETDFPKIAVLFDSIDVLCEQFGLLPAEKADVELQRILKGTKEAVKQALEIWRNRDPYKATFKNLLIILLDSKKGVVAKNVANYISKRPQQEPTNNQPRPEERTERQVCTFMLVLLAVVLLSMALYSQDHDGLPILTMTDFKEYKANYTRWWSPPVYTHHQGYKICLRVDANGWDNNRIHVAVVVHFMRGDFDDSLKWPFRGTISFRLLDQLHGGYHREYTVIYDDTTDGRDAGVKVTEGDIAERSRGCYLIENSELKPNYLINNTLLFQIHNYSIAPFRV